MKILRFIFGVKIQKGVCPQNWIFLPKILKITSGNCDIDFWRQNSDVNLNFRAKKKAEITFYLIVFLSEIPNKGPQIIFGFDRFGINSHRDFENCWRSISHHLSKIRIHSFIIPRNINIISSNISLHKEENCVPCSREENLLNFHPISHWVEMGSQSHCEFWMRTLDVREKVFSFSGSHTGIRIILKKSKKKLENGSPKLGLALGWPDFFFKRVQFF